MKYLNKIDFTFYNIKVRRLIKKKELIKNLIFEYVEKNNILANKNNFLLMEKFRIAIEKHIKKKIFNTRD